MKKSNDRVKKIALVVGGIALCAALVLLIAKQFTPPNPVTPPVPPATSSSAPEVTPQPIQPLPEGEAKPKTEQQLQPEMSMPEPPAEPPKVEDEQLKNPIPSPHTRPSKVSPQPTPPHNGDKKDGQIYVEGFGWIKDEGGGAKGETAEDMYENGNKVGIM